MWTFEYRDEKIFSRILVEVTFYVAKFSTVDQSSSAQFSMGTSISGVTG